MRRAWLAAVVLVSSVCSATIARAADEPPPEAQAEYTNGRESFRLGLYGRALESFERSLASAPSPNTRLYIARTLRELGRLREAAEQYRLTMTEAEARGGKYVPTREAAELELRDVEVRIARAEPTRPEDVSEAVRVTPASAAAESAAPRAEDDRETRRSPRPSALTWISGGVAVAGAASFGVLYALASDRYGYLEDHCTTLRSAACDSARSTGRTEETIAYVALGVGALAATVAVISFVLEPSAAPPQRARGVWLTF